MKLKGRIIVAFTVVLVFPLLLTSIAVYTIVRFRYDIPNQKFAIDKDTVSMIANPIEYVNEQTREVYNEISLCLSNTPERLSKEEYLRKVSAKLSSYESSIVVEMNGKVTYNGDRELYARAKDVLDRSALITDSANNGNYFGDTGMLVKKLSRSQEYGEVISVFIITDMNRFVDNSKKGLISFAICVILIMLLTACLLALWLYRGIVWPINLLRDSTNRIKDGDLDTPIAVCADDEIGDLCIDFNRMREHIKDLLSENSRHEVDTRDLIVNISHDLKTPLTAIRGYSEGLLEGVARTPEKQEQYLQTISTKAEDMTALIDELSAYAKLDTNSMPYNFKNINIYDYFEDAITEIRTDMELQNMDLAFFPYADRNAEVVADPDQLKRVVNNIISNALKYRDLTKKGIICIRLIDADRHIRIEIEDNGKGIESKNLCKVFERFYRADASRNSKVGGSGLGLAISKKIIEDGGGKIWAESRFGVGTTLIFMLKKSDACMEKEARQQEKIISEEPALITRRDKKRFKKKRESRIKFLM